MKLMEYLAVLLIIVAVFAHEMRPRKGDWTSYVRFKDVQLQLELDVGSWPEICFKGSLRQSTKTIASVEFGHRHAIGTQRGIDQSTF